MAPASTGRVGRVLAGLLPELVDPDPAAAVRARIVHRIRGAHRDRVRRLAGDDPDLDVRADLGPAYLPLHGLFLGRAVSEGELAVLLAVMRQP